MIAVPTELPPELDGPVARLLTAIQRLPETKIVTVAGSDHVQKFDIAPDGTIGHRVGHDLLLRWLLAMGMEWGCGLIIRQFLPAKVERVVTNGKRLWIPRKRIYGVFLGGGTFRVLPPDEVCSAMTTDYATGAPLPAEDDVEYGELPLEESAPPDAPGDVVPMSRGTDKV